MDKATLLNTLCEPLSSLSSDQLTAIERMATTDPEVAEALRLSRLLERVSETQIIGSPRLSDAEFLSSLKAKVSRSLTRTVWRPFASTRWVGAMAVACFAAMTLIISIGRITGGWSAPDALLNSADVVDFGSLDASHFVTASFDTVEANSLDLLALADYLNIPQLASEWDLGDVTERPLTDELLALDEQTLKEVLNDLENTHFF